MSNSDSNTSDTPKDTISSLVEPYTLVLGDDMTQVHALYGVSHCDTHDTWKLAMEQLKSNWLGDQLWRT
jgi:hypothetical protein